MADKILCWQDWFYVPAGDSATPQLCLQQQLREMRRRPKPQKTVHWIDPCKLWCRVCGRTEKQIALAEYAPCIPDLVKEPSDGG